ncbi:MAG: hypothetical protein CO135_00705 [Candidatus Levybacteria bacterium CG_4_9_14_3_um_filter_35_16]|nr:MAG: hypothetical protein COW87_04620 [Candidatus Levybacteria bacterium CG22_combo_CG10-13_8_21_14_all_35_11]PIY94446.1 MAG: hypothetical protein COY68_02705 [Candidatus Levybacteria bacterium CG_4_10_14_0_8_um_filter_35_23]PIZ98354.1 MAG: hypothetical protein COX78_03250 [Candidatus Levybacteria bacterium CG_4_10_14_0_2_um_filter_35_8]PJA91539.1 MAG: hypothetical protein CO135_00705 [Candidatus Levybacteria bacterium CG_4_9_14_3_um_filter_35_16]PJC54565.1 MAG: hypothetical protein CO028_01
MKKDIWEKRIPSILGIFLIIIGIIATSFLIQQGIIFITKAAPSNIPKNVRITNVTDSSFTVSYITDDKVIGSINLGPSKNLGQISRDDRDQQSGNLGTFRLHNITVRNLKPTTKYYFSIISGKDIFSENNQSYEIDTSSPVNSEPSSQKPISGKVLLTNGANVSEAIVYATIDGAQAISTVVKSDGRYILPLNSLRNSGLNSYFQFGDNLIKMLIVGPDSQTSNVILNLKQINPVPSVTLEKNYDFSQSSEPISSASAQFQQFPSFSNGVQSKKKIELKITSPQDNESFSDQQPVFKGVALPNETVKIEIHSPLSIQDEVTTDIYGNWRYRPSQPLGTGEHTINITTKNSSGITQTFSRNFVIFELGSQVSESATPSATPTTFPTPTPTPTVSGPTVTPKISLTPTATLTPTPTPTVSGPTVTPTITPTIVQPIPTVIKSPSPTISSPGNPSGIAIGIFGIIIILIGGFLFLLTRGNISSL